MLCVDSSRVCMSGLSLCDLCLCYSILGSQFSNKYLLIYLLLEFKLLEWFNTILITPKCKEWKFERTFAYTLNCKFGVIILVTPNLLFKTCKGYFEFPFLAISANLLWKYHYYVVELHCSCTFDGVGGEEGEVSGLKRIVICEVRRSALRLRLTSQRRVVHLKVSK